jgi:hypothetical protein
MFKGNQVQYIKFNLQNSYELISYDTKLKVHST